MESTLQSPSRISTTISSTIRTANRAGFLDVGRNAALATSGFSWGPNIAALYAANAARFPLRPAIIDDHGTLTFLQLHRRTNRVAAALSSRGVGRKSTIGILCRNHRGFVEATIAAAKLNARSINLNTGLAPAQLGEILEREGVDLVIADARLAAQLVPDDQLEVIVVAPEHDASWSFPTLPKFRPFPRLPKPGAMPNPVLLTSGTSGVPKGANRSARAEALAGAFGFLERVPYRRGEIIAVPAPLFHAWGYSQLVLAASLAGTVVLQRHFDPQNLATAIRSTKATALAAVPVMLHRIIESVIDPEDLASLHLVATSGSALRGDLATAWMSTYGPNLYNVYGSTEAGQISVADPTTLEAFPDSAGRILPGVEVQIRADEDTICPDGEVGDIIVSSGSHFDGYTSGDGKTFIDHFMVTGDVGYLDGDILFVLSRADDMIISGGENLYPSTIEDTLAAVSGVSEVVVIGIADDDLGQKVSAFVVPNDNTSPAALTKKLRSHAKKNLATYERPQDYSYLDELPRNRSGKILRRNLIPEPAAKKPSQTAGKPAGRRTS